MHKHEPNVATIIGISEEDADNIIKLLNEIHEPDEGVYALVKAAAEKFGKKPVFIGWVLGHMMERIHHPGSTEHRAHTGEMLDMAMRDGAAAMLKSLKHDGAISDRIDEGASVTKAIQRYASGEVK